MSTYTILNRQGDVIGRSLSLPEAMDAILSDDGYEWKISPNVRAPGWSLWHSSFSRNSPSYCGLIKTVIGSGSDDADEARNDIAEKVVASVEMFLGRGAAAMTDDAYDAMIREWEADK